MLLEAALDEGQDLGIDQPRDRLLHQALLVRERGAYCVQIQRVDEDLAKTYRLKEPKGAVVSQVTTGSPAEKAGLKAEDVVVSVDGRSIHDNGDLSRYISSQAPGKTVKLDVLRDGGEKTIAVTLGTFPDEKSDEEATAGQKGKLGMTLRDLTPALSEKLELPKGTKGALVWEVEAGQPAEDAGLQRGEVIVSVNGTGVASVEDFEKAIELARRDGAARLRVYSAQQNAGFRIVVLKLK